MEKIYSVMVAANVLPADLSAARAHAASIDCLPVVHTKWREAIKHLEDGAGVAGVKDAVDIFISSTKHLVEHAASTHRELCVSYCQSSNEHDGPVNIDGVPLEQLSFNMSVENLLNAGRLDFLLVDYGCKRGNLCNDEFSKVLLLIISGKVKFLYITETT